VRKRTTCRLRRTMVMTIKPRALAHYMLVVLYDGDDNMALCASARHAGRVAQWQQRYGLVCKHTTCRLCHTMATTTRPCAQAQDMPVALHDGNGDNISGNKDNKVNEYHHTSCTSAPGF
jgi:hypothetical protein